MNKWKKAQNLQLLERRIRNKLIYNLLLALYNRFSDFSADITLILKIIKEKYLKQ